MSKDRIVIVGVVGVPASYGGFETLAENLIEDELNSFVVYCSSKSFKSKRKHYKNAELRYIPFKANGPQSIIYDALSIFDALLKGDRKFLVLGVSGALFFPLIKFFYKDIFLATNIDGIEWKRNKWSVFTKSLLKFFEYMAVNFSDRIIVDNLAIQKYVSMRYGLESELIEYGGDHVKEKKTTQTKIRDLEKNYSLCICRIEPENNIHLILEAYRETKLNLKFIGNWDISSYSRELYTKFSSCTNIELLPPIYNNEVLHEYRTNCKDYVHGHSAGGTNPSLVEMMHFGKQVYAFDCSYNRETMESKGLYFKNAEELIVLLKQPQKPKIGIVLADIAARRYTWSRIRKLYLKIFNVF